MKPIPYEKVLLADAKRVHDGKPAAIPPDWSVRRGAVQRHEVLSEPTRQWIDSLPADVRPHHLAQRYARIANTIGGLWPQPVRCASYLADLLIVRRAHREGFPFDVANDIAKLAAHHALLHPLDRRWTQAH